MATSTAPAVGTAEPAQQALVVLPPGVSIHMIAFAEYLQAVQFLDVMKEHADRCKPGVAHTTIVRTKDQFIAASQVPCDLILVSAHGPVFKPGEPLAPAIGDGNPQNRIDLHELADKDSVRLGARAGIIWDACNTGRPAFRAELARLTGDEVVHVAPIGKIWWDDSVQIAGTIFDALLGPGGPPITSGAVAAASATAAASARIRLWHGRLASKNAP